MRVIGSDGEMIGVLTRDEALRMAEEEGLDLVEIQPNADPPVCKIMDFGKFRFEQQKKANEAKKFLEHHDKVLVYVVFKGREMQHIEEGKRILQAMREKLVEMCKIEKEPSLEGKRMSMMLAPK